jgi:hypothetical protein
VSGTLTVTNGVLASEFVAASDGHSGTLSTFTSATSNNGDGDGKQSRSYDPSAHGNFGRPWLGGGRDE